MATDWGIFDATTLLSVFDYDTFMSFKITDTSKVSDFPVEDGAFATYNKVSKAYTVNVQLAISEGSPRRATFLNKLASVRKGLDLMNIVTQDRVYLNATLENYVVSRVTKGGVGQVIADLAFIEVRTVARQYGVAKVRQAGAAKVTSSGQVGPAPLTAAVYNFLVQANGGAPLPNYTLPVQSSKLFANGFTSQLGVPVPTGMGGVMQAAHQVGGTTPTTPATR